MLGKSSNYSRIFACFFANIRIRKKGRIFANNYSRTNNLTPLHVLRKCWIIVICRYLYERSHLISDRLVIKSTKVSFKKRDFIRRSMKSSEFVAHWFRVSILNNIVPPYPLWYKIKKNFCCWNVFKILEGTISFQTCNDLWQSILRKKLLHAKSVTGGV